MNESVINQFESTWKDFMVKIRAQINKRSAGHFISYSVLQAVLEDCKMDWEVSDNKFGRWLSNYAGEYPEQAKIVRQILVKDMHFTQRPEKPGMPYAVKAAVPVAGALAGFSVSHFCFHAPMIAQIACTVIPAVAAPPVMKAIDAQMGQKNITSETEAYMEQLQKYYLSVKGILETK